MKEYRCYFLNRRGGIGDVVEFVSPDDRGAEQIAREHFERQTDYPSFEIWEKARLVLREIVGSQVARS